MRERKEAGLAVLFKNKENAKHLAEIAPFTAGYPLPDRGEVYYLCKGTTCFEAQRTMAGLKRLMDV